jgi:hypothetical protein
MSCWRSYCAVGVPAYASTQLRVSLLLLTLCCSYCLSCCGLLHAVAGFNVFARIPAFDSVHTVLAVLLLLSFLLLLAFLLL